MPEARIAARNLSVGYGKETVVAGLDFTLEAGETLALVGVNGSGKSTLLKTMAGLIPVVSGGLEVLGGAPRSQPGRVAYLGQFHPTGMSLPLRASDVVRMGRFSSLGLFGKFAKEDEEAVEEAMVDMDVVRFADQPLNRLSGGQRQRVFIAQALARRADLLLLDEPASSLDAQAVETYRDLVRAAARRGAVAVIATHDIDEAASCDRAMLLAHRVVAYGPSAAVLNPTALLETFGIVGRYREGGLVAVGREHDHCHDDGE